MDIDYLLLLQSLRDNTSHIFDKFFLYVTGYGEMVYLLPLFALIYWCINKKTGEFMFLSLAFARLVNGFIKIFACVYRPWIKDPRIQPLNNGIKTATGYSFPSGHTANAVSTFGSYSVREKKDSKFLKVLLWGIAILVGFSRNYIGVHTPQDVIVSFIFSLLAIFGTVKLFDILEKNKKADIWVAVGGLAISILIIIFANYKSYPITFKSNDNIENQLVNYQAIQNKTSYMKLSEINKDIAKKSIVNPKEMVLDLYKNIGYIIGILLGWIIERKYVKFSTEGATSQKVLRFLVCFILMQIMLNIFCPILKKSMIESYSEPLISFLKTFYIIGIAPFIIKFLQRNTNTKAIAVSE